jgi:hypothetical protein
MSLEFDAPEEKEQTSQWLKAKGIFHFAVTAVDPNPVSQAGQQLPGIKVTLAVMGGTDPAQLNKQWDVVLFQGTAEDKETTRDLNNRRLDRFFEAVGIQKHVITGSDGRKRVRIDDPMLAVGRQFIGETEPWLKDNGKTQMGWAWDNLYHVDDPRVKDVPRNQEAIALIPQSLRRQASSFTVIGGAPQQPVAAPPLHQPKVKVDPMQLLQQAAHVAPVAPVAQPQPTTPVSPVTATRAVDAASI